MVSARKTQLVSAKDLNQLPVSKLLVVICPGFHETNLTQRLIASLPSFVDCRVLETSPIAPVEICRTLVEYAEWLSPSPVACPPVVGIGFSAGVLGLAGGLALWQQQGGGRYRVSRLIAVDGWGVPVVGMPVTRLSHDYFTHLTSLPLGAGEVNFVAHPPVAHLNLWGQPESVMGFEVSRCQGAKGVGMPMTAGQFLRRVLQAEWNGASSWRHAAANAAHKSG